MGQLIGESLHQMLLGLLRGKAGDPFEHFKLALLQAVSLRQCVLDLLLLLGNEVFLLLVIFDFAVERFFLLLNAALLPLDVVAAFLDFAL